MAENYITDCEKIDIEISGYFAELSEGGKPIFCLVCECGDVSSIEQLVNCGGYTSKSLEGKRITIQITED